MRTPISLPTSPQRFLTTLMAGLVALSNFCLTPGAQAQTTWIWDGGTLGTGTVMSTTTNWAPDGTPVASNTGSGGSNNNTAQWNGTAAGNLALTLGADFGSGGNNNGLILSLTSDQEDSVSITGGYNFRVSTVNLASGSGAFSVGASGSTLIWRIGGNTHNTSATFTNNSANTATIGSSVALNSGGIVSHALTFAGSGNWDVAGVLSNFYPSNATNLDLTKTGAGTLTVRNALNVYGGGVIINQGTFQAQSNTALGFGAVMTQNYMTTAGTQVPMTVAQTAVNSGGTLDLYGSVTVNEPVNLNGGSLINSLAASTATLDNGLAGIQLLNRGTGYSDAATTLSITGGGGSGATAGVSVGVIPSNTGYNPYNISGTTYNPNPTGTSGVANYLWLTNGGSGYTSAPTVTLSGGGSNFSAQAVLSSLALTGTTNQIGGAGNLQIKAVVSGSGGFTKVDAGTATFSAANTYTGATLVSAGTLLVSGTGSINTSSAVTVNGGTLRYNSSTNLTAPLIFTSGKLAGTNFAGNTLSIGTNQTISPGNSTGTLVSASQTWAGGGTYEWEINDATGPAGGDGWDLLNITGDLTITANSGSQFNINVISLSSQVAGSAANFDSLVNGAWLIADATSAITTFDASAFNINLAQFQNAYDGVWSVALGDSGSFGGDNSQIYLTYSAIPEPSTTLLLAGALTALVIFRRRRA